MDNRDFLDDFFAEMEKNTAQTAESKQEETTAKAVTKPEEVIPKNLPKESVTVKEDVPAASLSEETKIAKTDSSAQTDKDENEETVTSNEDENENESEQSKEESAETEQISLLGDTDFEAALKKSEEKSKERILASLLEKKPIFKYGDVSDSIDEKDATFEDLRKKYEDDFPELEAKSNISWTVTYGKTVQSISNPSKEKVFEVKSKIEKTDKFINDLKKAKSDADKNPDCVVKPFVKAQKKGEVIAMPDYKGFFMNYSDAIKSNKVISLVPARDGKIYEIRKNQIGTFVSPAVPEGRSAGSNSIRELDNVNEKFVLGLPKIPIFLLYQVISFFRAISIKKKLEVLVHLVYDTETEKYNVKVPKQKVTQMSVDSEGEEYPENIIHVMDIHSHNVMDAHFSRIDDKDEKATRLYGVIGKLDRVIPRIALRASNGGKFIKLNADDIFDYEAIYPEEWFENLNHEMAEAICEAELDKEVAVS